VQGTIQDSLNILSKLNGRRLRNALQLWLSYKISKSTKRLYHWGLPAVMEIEPTTSCNLRCPQCPSGLRSFSRDTGMLNLERYQAIIDELHPTLWYLLLYFQGEPFLNPDFLKFVRYASAKNIYTATSSNGHYFTDKVAKETVQSGLDRLIISIDGTTQDTYSKYRIGGNLEKVIEGTKNLLAWREKLNAKTPHIVWQFIAFKHNEHQIEELKALAKQVGVDAVGIKTAQIYDYTQDTDFIPEDGSLSRYLKTEQGYVIKNDFLNQCWRMWKGSVITWDGLVVPCCFDKDAKHQFGNIEKEGFVSVWRNESYNRFRKAILQSRHKIDICTNCTEGTKVWSRVET
jgi:radical SAM protein with 4Fe4S-binding SPASM domain